MVSGLSRSVVDFRRWGDDKRLPICNRPLDPEHKTDAANLDINQSDVNDSSTGGTSYVLVMESSEPAHHFHQNLEMRKSRDIRMSPPKNLQWEGTRGSKFLSSTNCETSVLVSSV
jgi:hypothetical protein